ncbi:MAG: fluoride efflux transporter CrcB [Verrucomicrobiia bacterium]
MLKVYLVIMAGGALGSAGRFALSLWILERFGDGFPLGTLAVNLTGSFLIGLIYGLTAPDGLFPEPPLAREFLILGVLGGFTTFSTFSLQTLHLLQAGHWGLASINIIGSVTLCLLAAWFGWGLATLLSR